MTGMPREIHIQFDKFGCGHISEPPLCGAVKFIRADVAEAVISEKIKEFHDINVLLNEACGRENVLKADLAEKPMDNDVQEAVECLTGTEYSRLTFPDAIRILIIALRKNYAAYRMTQAILSGTSKANINLHKKLEAATQNKNMGDAVTREDTEWAKTNDTVSCTTSPATSCKSCAKLRWELFLKKDKIMCMESWLKQKEDACEAIQEAAAIQERIVEGEYNKLHRSCDGLVKALGNLTNDCIASDFNEHWDSYINAQIILSEHRKSMGEK